METKVKKVYWIEFGDFFIFMTFHDQIFADFIQRKANAVGTFSY